MAGVPYLVGITGLATAGKDTLGAMLSHLEGHARYAFADPLKDLAYSIGWDGTKRAPEEYTNYSDFNVDETWSPGAHNGRALLQELGVGVREVLGEDAWVRALMARVMADANLLSTFSTPEGWPCVDYLEAPYRVVVTDVRFENEADFIHRMGGVIWRVERDVPKGSHESEQGVLAITPDEVFPNYGTKEELDSLLKEHLYGS